MQKRDERRVARLNGLEAAAILLALVGIPLSTFPTCLGYAFPLLALSVLLAAAGVLASTRKGVSRKLLVFMLCAAALLLARLSAPRVIETRDYVPRVFWELLGWQD